MAKDDMQRMIYEMVKSLNDKVDRAIEKIDRVEIQTVKTNGRVTAIEKKEEELAPVRKEVIEFMQKFKNDARVRAMMNSNKKWWADFWARHGISVIALMVAILTLIWSRAG